MFGNGVINCEDTFILSFVNKRIETPGVLIGNLIYQATSKIIKEMKQCIIKEVDSDMFSISNNNIPIASYLTLL